MDALSIVLLKQTTAHSSSYPTVESVPTKTPFHIFINRL